MRHTSAALDGHRRAQDAVVLDAVVDLRLFAHAGGVDEVVLALLVFKVRVDGVARGARDVADDDALLARMRLVSEDLPTLGCR